MSEGPPKVLLVDDEAAITDGLAPFLQRSGFAVTTAADGDVALEECRTLRPDVVVCDVVMPTVDGREVVRRLRAQADWTPVILLTKVGESHERSAALEEGADDYLNKPFDPRSSWPASGPCCVGPRPASVPSLLRAGSSAATSSSTAWRAGCSVTAGRSP
ncbi:response regulator transcription factor [Phycicoccus sp. HDW14]|uniref:response regulator transcription factor n=1 Tax=Phycicoccus sp. HDW14 TaxID=2714941 RepID=UPI00353027E2